MLTPKTIAMNAAKRPTGPLYRRTGTGEPSEDRPHEDEPSWLMSMAFPRRMGEIPAIPDKGTGAFSLEITTPSWANRRKTQLLLGQMPGGVALVRFDCVSCVRDRERRNEHVLRELRDPPRFRRPAAPGFRPAGPPPAAPASVCALSDAPTRIMRPSHGGRRSRYVLRPFRRPGRRTSCPSSSSISPWAPRPAHSGGSSRTPSSGASRSAGVSSGPLDDPATVNLGSSSLVIATFAISASPHEHRFGRHDGVRVRRYRGEPMTVETGLPTGLQRFLSILGANILLGLLILGLVTLPFVLILVALVAGLAARRAPSPSSAVGSSCWSCSASWRLFLYISLRPLHPRDHDGECEARSAGSRGAGR